MSNNIGDWSKYLKGTSKQEYFVRLLNLLKQRYIENKIIYPDRKKWFYAFELTHFKDVKVLILGQDPYHNKSQAHGLSFSVPFGTKIPPSLRNIYQELYTDLQIKPANNGDLTAWAKQGVLLLNSVLTVEEKSPSSHANYGWEKFTDNIISILSENKEHLVFILWGSYAQKKSILINKNKHLVLTASHPSPFSAHKGFFGCKHFSKTNNYLLTHNKKIIDWKL
jgi:uracil-DNA glycosylase